MNFQIEKYNWLAKYGVLYGHILWKYLKFFSLQCSVIEYVLCTVFRWNIYWGWNAFAITIFIGDQDT